MKFLSRLFFEMSTRSRILWTSLVLTLGLTLITAGLAVKKYSHDKLAYLHELHAARTGVVAARMRETLAALIEKANPSPWNRSLPADLQRFPYDNEIFVSSQKKQLKLFSTDSTHQLNAQNVTTAPFESALEPVAGTPLLVVSQAGVLLLSQNNTLSGDETEALVHAVFKSQMTEGHTVFRVGAEDLAVGFHEVPDTNLLVIALTPLKTLLQPLREGMRTWLLMIIPIFLVGLILQSWILSRIDKPLRQMIGFFEMLVRGRWDAHIAVPRGEFAPVFAGAVALQNAVAERESRLRQFSAGLRQTIEFSNQHELARDLRESAVKLSDVLSPVFPTHHEFSPRFFDLGERILWQRQNNGHWISNPADESFLTVELESSEFLQGGIRRDVAGNEHFDELFIPILDDENCTGVILVPLAPQQQIAELWNLAPIICKTLSEMILRCKSSDRAAHEAQREHELSLARQMLERSLVLDTADISGVWFSSLFEPAENVGGDWMGVFAHPDADVVNIYVGDVTGHGLDSAFHAALISGAIKAAENDLSQRFKNRRENQPANLADFNATDYLKKNWHRLNKVFLDSTSDKMMTMLFMSLDLRSGALTLLSAGHPAPLLITNNTESTEHRQAFLSHPAPPLGSSAENQTIIPQNIILQSGDILLAFTDGFDENVVTAGGHLPKRIISRAATTYLRQWQVKEQSSLQELYAWSLRAGSSYNKSDDVSLLAIKYLGPVFNHTSYPQI